MSTGAVPVGSRIEVVSSNMGASKLDCCLHAIDQHVLGRISAVAQIPLHTVAFIAQVVKTALRYPVCAIKNWYHNQASAVAKRNARGIESNDYLSPVKKDIIVAHVLFKRIGKNFKDAFMGSTASSPTFKSAIINVITVPFAGQFSMENGLYNYQSKDVDSDVVANRLLFTHRGAPIVIDLDAAEDLYDDALGTELSRDFSLGDLVRGREELQQECRVDCTLSTEDYNRQISEMYETLLALGKVDLAVGSFAGEDYNEGAISEELFLRVREKSHPKKFD